VPDRIFHGVALGSWALTSFRWGTRELVIALDARTYAILLFPFTPRYHFRANFGVALAGLLEDLHFSPCIVAQECAAIQFELVTQLDGSWEVLETLSDAQRLCEFDLVYTGDLRYIQRHVNEYPFAAGPAASPIEALAEVYSPALMRRWVRH
jgi:hypothetical protein